MKYYMIKPEVAGGLGDKTVMDRSVHPPKVDKLHYVFDGWSGDVLLTSFPCYIVTLEAQKALEEHQFSGVSFSNVEVSKSDTFNELHPDEYIPDFSWLKVNGIAGKNDFGIGNNRMIVSERVLDILNQLGINEAIVSEYEG